MSIFSRKANDTPEAVPTVETSTATPKAPPSPVAPYQPNEVVFMLDTSGIMPTIIPARVQDKVLSRTGLSYMYIVETPKGRIQASPFDILTVATVQIALDQLPAFGGEPSISLDDPDK